MFEWQSIRLDSFVPCCVGKKAMTTTTLCSEPWLLQQQMNPCVPCINLDNLPHSRIPLSFPFSFSSCSHGTTTLYISNNCHLLFHCSSSGNLHIDCIVVWNVDLILYSYGSKCYVLSYWHLSLASFHWSYPLYFFFLYKHMLLLTLIVQHGWLGWCPSSLSCWNLLSLMSSSLQSCCQSFKTLYLTLLLKHVACLECLIRVFRSVAWFFAAVGCRQALCLSGSWY